eukprot:453271-Karenia_brevis.AAC.1
MYMPLGAMLRSAQARQRDAAAETAQRVASAYRSSSGRQRQKGLRTSQRDEGLIMMCFGRETCII